MDSNEERNWVYCGMIKLLGSFLNEKRGDSCLDSGCIGVFYVSRVAECVCLCVLNSCELG